MSLCISSRQISGLKLQACYEFPPFTYEFPPKHIEAPMGSFLCAFSQKKKSLTGYQNLRNKLFLYVIPLRKEAVFLSLKSAYDE